MPISDDAFANLARACPTCPNLKKLHLEGAVLIKSTCIPPVLTSCPELTSFSITGHKGRLGSIDLAILIPLGEHPELIASAPKLTQA